MIHRKLEYQTGGNRMSTLTSDPRTLPAGEPKPIISPLSSFYWHARDLGWLVVRLTAGGRVVAPRLLKGVAVGPQGLVAAPRGLAPGHKAAPRSRAPPRAA